MSIESISRSGSAGKHIRRRARLLPALALIASAGVGAAAPGIGADAAVTPAENETQGRWNLIFIMTDDQGAWTIGAYGNEDAVTPNIDRLAATGARFTNAFSASPVCAPSRVSFLTGLYPTQAGFPFVEDRTRDGLPAQGLPRGVPTWPRELKKHGYKTGLIGKWHLGRTVQSHPRHYGIDYFFGFHRGGNYPMNPWLFREGQAQGEQFKGSLPDILTDDAIRFVERHRDEPFALMLHYRAPHLPFGPVPKQDTAPYRDLDPALTPLQRSREADFTYIVRRATSWPEAREMHDSYVKRRLLAYYASVHSVDRNVGRLLDRLGTLGLAERTIIIFTSDQGYLLGHRGLEGKGVAAPIRGSSYRARSRSPNLWDLATRIPYLVVWPGVVRPGTVIDELVSNVDVPVSILDMLGVPVPPEWPANGRDMTPLLKGEETSWPNVVYGALDVVKSNADGEFVRMIRTERWKLVKAYFAPGRAAGQLYDLENDPDELRNLYLPDLDTDTISNRTADWSDVNIEHPFANVRDSLEQRLIEWQESISDPVLDAERAYLGAIDAARAKWSLDAGDPAAKR